MIVLDTNVVSEVLKPSPSETVLRWLAAQEAAEIFITAITQAEILYGIESLPSGKRRTRLYAAIETIFAVDFKDRILSFENESARAFAKLVSHRESLGQPISQFDAMIAAVANSRHAALATRNTRHFQHCGVRIINPWE